MPATQMNVRLDSELKRRGDEALERRGISPSAIMRSVWSVLAEGGEQSRELFQLLDGGSSPASSRDAKIAAAQQGWSLYRTAMAAAGYHEAALTRGVVPSDDELLEEALFEKMSERGLV